MKEHVIIKLYRRGWVSAAVAGLAMAYLLHMSWMRWGDLIIDLGRELYVPARLAAGDILYRDIFYLYGPFSPYFNAFLYKLFGVQVLSLVIGSVVVTGLVSLLLYKIARAFMGVFFSTFTLMAFLFVLAFGNYVAIGNYSFILPYSFPATHGMLFALGAFYFLFRHLDHGRLGDVAGAGACVFLCLITRAEMGVMLLAVMLAALMFAGSPARRRSLACAGLFFPAVAALAVYGVFFGMAGERIFASNLSDIFSSNVQGGRSFAGILAGMDAVGPNLWLMIKTMFFYVFMAGWFMLAGYGAGFVALRQEAWARWLGYAAIALGSGIGGVIFSRSLLGFELQYRSLPLICLIVGGIAMARYFREGRKAVDLKLALLAAFSFLALLRIMLNAHAWHYGFSLLVPGFVVYHAFFFYVLPRLARGAHVTMALAFGFVLILALLMADHFAITKASYRQRVVPVVSPAGRIMSVDNDRTRGCAEVIRFLRERTPPGATVAVFPEGVMINFLAGRRSPLYDYSFLPQDMARLSVEDSVLAQMASHPPDYVVVLRRPVEEYGRRGFGVDYALKLADHIGSAYMPVAQYGPLPFTASRFSAVILQRQQ